MKKIMTLPMVAGLLLAACQVSLPVTQGNNGQATTSPSGNPTNVVASPNSSASPGSQAQVSGPATCTNCNLTTKKASQLIVTPDNFTMNTNTTRKISGTVRYTDGTSDGDITLSSSDDTRATVNPTTGQINGVAPGEVTIEAIARKDPSVRARVLVTIREGTDVALLVKVDPATASLNPGDTVQLNATVQTSGSGGQNANVVWSSSNKSVAFVGERDGLVTAVGNGTATITAVAENDPSKRASATITVGSSPSSSPAP